MEQSKKSFSIPKDLSWTTTIQDKWQHAENEKKGIDPTKNKELEKYNVYALIIHDSKGTPRVFWKIEDKQSGYGIVNPELYQYVTKVGHYLEPELIQFMTYDTYQEKVNAAWRQGVNYETGEKLDPLLGSIVSTSQYVKDGYTWINESELGQALMILGFTYASYKVLTTTGVKQVESGKLKEVGGGEATNNYSQLREYWKKDVDFKGTKVYQRDSIIDINKIDVKGRSNLQRMELGLAPLGPDDNPINLHHMTQRDISSIAEVEQSFHQINSKTIHINPNSVPSGIDRKSFNKWRADYWKNRANDFK